MGKAWLVAPCLLAIAAAGVPAGRVAIGQYGRWGAFRDATPPRCFAIAEPISDHRAEVRPFLAVARRPRDDRPAEVHARLSRPSREASLTIGERTFALTVRGSDAWARDRRDDQRIVAAMRRGPLATIRGRDTGGTTYRDLYPLDGAPSAIDAMRIGCATGGRGG